MKTREEILNQFNNEPEHFLTKYIEEMILKHFHWNRKMVQIIVDKSEEHYDHSDFYFLTGEKAFERCTKMLTNAGWKFIVKNDIRCYCVEIDLTQ